MYDRKCLFIKLSITHNKLLANAFTATSFDPKIEPSSGRHTRTEKQKLFISADQSHIQRYKNFKRKIYNCYRVYILSVLV